MTVTTLPTVDPVLGRPQAVVSLAPMALPGPAGGALYVRISAPVAGTELPVVVFSHGNGWSHDGYRPLADFWASHGFVVVQPTHPDSRALGLPHDDPRRPAIWQTRAEELIRVIDELPRLVGALPGLAGRVDAARLAVAGHSWGAQTASLLLGARVRGEASPLAERFLDTRVRAGVLFTLPGLGGELTPFAREHLPFMDPDFSAFDAPALLVAGDRDQSQLTTRGPDWWADAYRHAPAPKALLTVRGGEHSLGGIVGYEVAETTDPNPAAVALQQRLSAAYLRTALGGDARTWRRAVDELSAVDADVVRVEER